jgi:hypothetical protein
VEETPDNEFDRKERREHSAAEPQPNESEDFRQKDLETEKWGVRDRRAAELP